MVLNNITSNNKRQRRLRLFLARMSLFFNNENVAMLISNGVVIWIYGLLSKAPDVQQSEIFPVVVLICLIASILTNKVIRNYRNPRFVSLFCFLVWYGYFGIIYRITNIPSFTVSTTATTNSEIFYVTSPKTQCRLCLFEHQHHIQNYTVVRSVQASSFDELANRYRINGEHLKDEWRAVDALSFFITNHIIFKSQMKSTLDWTIILQDNVHYMPDFNTKLSHYLDFARDNQYDIVFLDVQCTYAYVLSGLNNEMSIGIAYNNNKIKEFIRMSHPDSRESHQVLANGNGRGHLSFLFATLCNQHVYKCTCQPFVREVYDLPSTVSH